MKDQRQFPRRSYKPFFKGLAITVAILGLLYFLHYYAGNGDVDTIYAVRRVGRYLLMFIVFLGILVIFINFLKIFKRKG